MEHDYRAELSTACPEVSDDARFAQESSAVAAHGVFSNMQEHLYAALKEDEEWGISGIRARILSRLGMFLGVARSADRMPALCEVCASLLGALRSIWPEATPLPIYPAFRSNTK